MPPKPRARRDYDWHAIRRDYEAGELTVEAICAVYDISEWYLYDERERVGWRLRCPRRPVAVTSSETEMSARLINALDEKMRRFEQRLQATTDASSAVDSERDARTLNTLVRLFEKLTTLHGSKASAARALAPQLDASETTAAKETYDPTPLRGELARRLERLRGQIGG